MKQFGIFRFRVISVLAILLFVIPGLVFATAARDFGGQGTAEAKTHELVLLHTNDHHGTILLRSGAGGLAERAAYINGIRALNPNVLLLDAGDFNTGTALSNMFAAEPDLLAYNNELSSWKNVTRCNSSLCRLRPHEYSARPSISPVEYPTGHLQSSPQKGTREHGYRKVL